MFEKINPLTSELFQILDEITLLEREKTELIKETDLIELSYQEGEMDYDEYSSKLESITGGKAKKQVIVEIDMKLFKLIKKIQKINSKIFYLVHQDHSFENLRVTKKKEIPAPLVVAPLPKKVSFWMKVKLFFISLFSKKEKEDKAPEKFEGLSPNLAIEQKTLKEEAKDTNDYLSGDVPRPTIKSRNDGMHFEGQLQKKRTFLRNISDSLLGKNRKNILEDFDKQKEAPLGPSDNVEDVGIINNRFFKQIFNVKKEKEIISDENIVPKSIFRVVGPDEDKVSLEVGRFDRNIIEMEAREMKRILEAKKAGPYKPSSLGFIANMAIRKLSLYFIESFPEFFENLYKSLRNANIKIISNTYVNIMFFMMIVMFFVSTIFSLFIFIVYNPSIFIAFLKALMVGLLSMLITFFIFVKYPDSKSSWRRRSINANMPFAITHMSALATSGVSPQKMFELIAKTGDYGEVSIELREIVDYINVFGYDLLTAIRTVAQTCPSPTLKEFFEGFVSTIETGGDLNSFLTQKSEEAILTYRLERQQYVEAISTYSDIYTGVLIAAPLFFVSALALISILGGKMGGLTIDVVMVLGTYLVIPALNVMFLLFLILTQPEI